MAITKEITNGINSGMKMHVTIAGAKNIIPPTHGFSFLIAIVFTYNINYQKLLVLSTESTLAEPQRSPSCSGRKFSAFSAPLREILFSTKGISRPDAYTLPDQYFSGKAPRSNLLLLFHETDRKKENDGTYGRCNNGTDPFPSD